jgi:TolB-like protein/Tfp pilus assembly protein PilF
VDVSNELRQLRKELERSESGAVARPVAEKVASIAVLPFVNRSASADDEYFSDGLADELLNVLAKIKGLRVVARTSSFQFKGTKDDIATIGARLDVATVLEGSVRKAGPRVRISVQLVRVADSSHLWSEIYDRTLEDIFAVQDDIARSVVKELRTTLLGEEEDSNASGEVKAEVSNAVKGRATDPEAHRLYLLASHLSDRLNRENTTKAIEYFRQALELDPEFALAWTALARAYARESNAGWVPTREGYVRARAAAVRALELEPDLAEAHAQLGSIRMLHDWDWRGAGESYARALDLAPGNPMVTRAAANFAGSMGRLDDAFQLSRRAMEQDPLSAASFHNLGTWLSEASRFDEAEEAFRRALELDPQRAVTRSLVALALLGQGRPDDALAMARQEPEEGNRLWALAIIHDAMGQGGESDAAIQELIERHADGRAYDLADVFAAHGAKDEAFEWLERAYVSRDAGLVSMLTDRWLRPLHGDPRWGVLLKKMGFEG